MSVVYISKSAHAAVKKYLADAGHTVELVTADARVGALVADHPDIFMCKMKNEVIFAQRSRLGPVYPSDIAYNAVCLDEYFAHNLKYTAPELIERACALGLKLINVSQGYTKCSTAVLSGSAVITADEGVFRALSPLPRIDVLKIRPGFIGLSGAEYGFIGGACGLVGETLIFNGEIQRHPDAGAILDFAAAHGRTVKTFPGLPLYDIGSIIEA